MSDKIKVIGIRWPKSVDILNQRKLLPEVELSINDGDSVTRTVENMLFDRNFSQCLLRWKNVVYVCDHRDSTTRQFAKTNVEYHPYISYLD